MGKVLEALLSHDDDEFKSCQLCRHEQGLLDELVQPEQQRQYRYTANLQECVER